MSYDIEFPNPFWLGIEIIESEDNLPSLGCQVDIKLELPRGKFEYTASDIWFECTVFDEFINQLNRLKSGTQTKAEFYDIDREIVLTFTNEQIELTVHRIHSEIGSGYLEFKRDFDADILHQHIEQICSFAKWW
ncbi:hypothetical protein L1077_08760 [Pseudoalteromonas luteoviolacea]|uniref:WapI family immunity protein n=1 Tax=Pseudoalteromonas luteoviolacea TaxID=43657 RepID=UPI001F2064ED|nr:hypothetical protein [Pseudoalteromonas luteoviolacea]MCF6439516.1 hypothetical protein [Pseudoalteromonas luteoviolacea]